MTATNFLGCSTSCVMVPSSATPSPFNNQYALAQGSNKPASGTLCLNGSGVGMPTGTPPADCFYTVSIKTPSLILSNGIMHFTVTVSWTPLIGTDVNKTELLVDLGDTRNIQPLDCSVAGSCT